MRGQVDRLAEAQRELDALDADAGLRPSTANPLAASLPPPAPATGAGGTIAHR